MLQNFIKRTRRIYNRLFFISVLFWRKNKDRFFYVSFKRGVPKIHINDQYEGLAKWIIRILTAIGIVTSVLAFEQWYLNLITALGLFGLEQLLEKSIFVYFTFYLTAIPEYKRDDWKGMVWVYSASRTNKYFEVGIMFSTREAAERIFSVIRHWSKDGDNDINNLVQVSVIINKLDYYHVYIYPNAEKDPVYIDIKKKRGREQPQKEHKIDVLAIMLCKGFNYADSTFPKFREFYEDGDSYTLCAYVFENNRPVKLSHLGGIHKNQLKIKNEAQLSKKDQEYEHTKFIINFEKYEEENPPEPSRDYIGYGL